jgi:hypothetical protein
MAPIGNVVVSGSPPQRPSLATIRPNLRAAQNATAETAEGASNGGGGGGGGKQEVPTAGGGGAEGRHWAGYHGELHTPRTPGVGWIVSGSGHNLGQFVLHFSCMHLYSSTRPEARPAELS